MTDACANGQSELALLEDENMKSRQLVQSLTDQVRKINAQIEAKQLAMQKQELEAKLQQAQEMLAAIDVHENAQEHVNEKQPQLACVMNAASAASVWNNKPVLQTEDSDMSSDSTIARVIAEQEIFSPEGQDNENQAQSMAQDCNGSALMLSKYDQQFPSVDTTLSPGEIAWGNYLQRQMQTVLKQNPQLDKKKAFGIACNVHTSECQTPNCSRDDCFFYHPRKNQTRKNRTHNVHCLKNVLQPTLGEKLIRFYENGLRFGNATCFFKCSYCPKENCDFAQNCNYAHEDDEKCEPYENAMYLAAHGFDMEDAFDELY